MPRKPVLYAVIAALTAALAFVLAQPAVSAATPVRIMPLGDPLEDRATSAITEYAPPIELVSFH